MEQVVEGVSERRLSDALVERLATVPILASLRPEEMHCVDGAEEVRIGDGEFVERQGDAPGFFYILLEGKLRLSQKQADGNEISIATMDAGTSLGELPLLTNSPYPANVQALGACDLLRLDAEVFWRLMAGCAGVRAAILGNMAERFQKFQNMTMQQQKMASLGTLAAGLMHELNNPGAAAQRAAAQLRENLMRMHQLSAKFSQTTLSMEQKQCMMALQEQALSVTRPLVLSSIEQSDAEEALAEWMESAKIEHAWKLAPTLAAIGMDARELECARSEFPAPVFSDALSWLEALVSSMQLVGMIEESIGRVADLVHAVKSYAYEGKGKLQTVDINDSIHATLVILGHKMREKEIVVEKDFGAGLPALKTECSGLNQIWTNLLDNAIDAVTSHGHIRVRTWSEKMTANERVELCISVADDGAGIADESQQRVFDPFYTTKPVGVGTGLGLGIVQRIVAQYGGSIRFSSVPGNTEFVVRLPVSAA